MSARDDLRAAVAAQTERLVASGKAEVIPGQAIAASPVGTIADYSIRTNGAAVTMSDVVDSVPPEVIVLHLVKRHGGEHISRLVANARRGRPTLPALERARIAELFSGFAIRHGWHWETLGELVRKARRDGRKADSLVRIARAFFRDWRHDDRRAEIQRQLAAEVAQESRRTGLPPAGVIIYAPPAGE